MNKRYVQLAELAASWSDAPVEKAGCVLVDHDTVVALSFNDMPRGIERHNLVCGFGTHGRPFLVPDGLSRSWNLPGYVECAARNAIYQAARAGRSTQDCTAYLTVAPCVACARALIQAGVAEVVSPEIHGTQARGLLSEAGLRLVTL